MEKNGERILIFYSTRFFQTKLIRFHSRNRMFTYLLEIIFWWNPHKKQEISEHFHVTCELFKLYQQHQWIHDSTWKRWIKFSLGGNIENNYKTNFSVREWACGSVWCALQIKSEINWFNFWINGVCITEIYQTNI